MNIKSALKVMRYAGGLLASFLAAWTAAYVLTWVSRGDPIEFQYYFASLKAVVTLSGGELVPFMAVLTAVLFFPLAFLVILVDPQILKDGKS